MKRPRSHVLEYESELAFRRMLPPEWVVRDKRNPDYGIDLEVEIVEKGKVTNKVLWVQLKATESTKHDGRTISYSMETRHLEHYENSRTPVLVLLWIKPENAFYYLFVQRYIHDVLSKDDPNWRTQKAKTLKFLADSKLWDANALKEIATDGYFYIVRYLYIVQQEPSVRNGAGLAVPPWLDGIPKSNDKALKEHTLKALLCMENKDYNGAIAEYKHILRVVCKTSSTERMSVLLNLGFAHYSLDQNDEALTYYDAVLELANEIDGEDALEGKAAAFGNTGQIYRDKGDLDTALKYFEAALKIDRAMGNRQAEAIQLYNICVVYCDRCDVNNALKSCEDALKTFDAIGLKGPEATYMKNNLIEYALGTPRRIWYEKA